MPNKKSLGELLFGRALPTEEQDRQKIGPLAAVPVLGLDALASAAYGPEAALTVMIPLGMAGIAHIPLITALVVGLLVVVQASYRQTLAAYPDGGGSYTVASQNLGVWPGLLAGAALFVDYVLNAAVAISAGVGALVSVVPALLPHTLWLCLLVLLVLTVVNLRGVRDSGLAFLIPTYLFIVSLGFVLLYGGAKALLGAGPAAISPVPQAAISEGASVWLLVRAFAAGCTAMTGIEAVSNAVPIFREPRVKNARRTLSLLAIVLAGLLCGIALLCRVHHIGATPPGQPGFQSVISQLTAAVVGRSWLYYVTMTAVVLVLCLSANTSFADFPRLCRVLAVDRFLPDGFAHRGSRLVYSHGIVLLSLAAALLLIVFGGITDRLIPLFAVGAFLAFTMSQLGMVVHTHRSEGFKKPGKLLLNATGAAATGITTAVIVVSKFHEGAWITALIVPSLILLWRGVRRHLRAVEKRTTPKEKFDLGDLQPPIVVVPLKRLDAVACKGLRFAMTLSKDVIALQMLSEALDEEDLTAGWPARVEAPARAAGRTPPALTVLASSRRAVIDPVVSHVHRLSHLHPDRTIAVLVPELVERRWYHALLHNHTASLLKSALLRRGGRRVAIVNTPYHLGQPDE